MNLKISEAILPQGFAFLSTWAKTFGGLLQPPLGELLFNISLLYCIVQYSIVLYYIVLYCIVLYCIVLYCIVL